MIFVVDELMEVMEDRNLLVAMGNCIERARIYKEAKTEFSTENYPIRNYLWEEKVTELSHYRYSCIVAESNLCDLVGNDYQPLIERIRQAYFQDKKQFFEQDFTLPSSEWDILIAILFFHVFKDNSAEFHQFFASMTDSVKAILRTGSIFYHNASAEAVSS